MCIKSFSYVGGNRSRTKPLHGSINQAVLSSHCKLQRTSGQGGPHDTSWTSQLSATPRNQLGSSRSNSMRSTGLMLEEICEHEETSNWDGSAQKKRKSKAPQHRLDACAGWEEDAFGANHSPDVQSPFINLLAPLPCLQSKPWIRCLYWDRILLHTHKK